MGGERAMGRSQLVIQFALLASLAAALKQGLYGGQHWKIVMSETQDGTGTIEGDCSTGTVGNMAMSEYKADTGSSINFTAALTLQFNNAKKNLTVTNAQLDKLNATLTGKFVAGAYEENFRVVHLATADLFKCINSSSSVKAGWFTVVLLAFTTLFFQHQ